MATDPVAGARRPIAPRIAFLVVHGLIAGPGVAGLALAAIGFGGLITGATSDPHGWAVYLSVTFGVASIVPVLALGIGFRRWWRHAPLAIVIVDGVLGFAALVGAALTASPDSASFLAPLIYALVAGAGAGLAAMIRP